MNARRIAFGQQAAQPLHFLAEDLGKRAFRRGGLAADCLGQRGFQLIEPQPPISLHLDDGNAKLPLQFLDVDLHAPIAGDVDHVQRHDGRQPQFEHLAHQVQVALQVAGIDDAQHGVGHRSVAAAAEQHVDGHHFIRRTRGQAVRAGQVDQGEPPALVRQMADLLLDRHARVIADLLPDAGQRAEQRRLAGIGVADQSHRAGGVSRGEMHGRE